MKIDFVSMAAHELRTPLAALRGYLELVAYKGEPEISRDAKRNITQALKSTGELSSLINNLLDVARIERGALVFDFGKVDLAEKVQKVVEDSRFAAQDKQLSLTYYGPDTGCDVYADDIAVREVINNLLSNAIKYTHEGGTIEVSLHKQHDAYAVSVKDTGIGIPKRALPHLFTKFYRVHGGLDSGSTGTGLGLFITRSILERHNGTVAVESEERVGSTFIFTLPMYKQDAHTSDEAQRDVKRSRRHRGWVTQNIDR